MTVEGLLANAERLERDFATDKVVGRVLMQSEDTIIRLQREQLFEGKDSDGNDMRPYYSEDEYFSSRAQAEWYINWKRTGIRYPIDVPRNPDAPNLYINGKFHSELQVGFMSDAVGIIPQTPYAAGIMAKYGMQKFGLTRQRWSAVLNASRDRLIERIKDYLYA